MKYKIILGSNEHKPFVVQRLNEKSLFKIWWTVDSFSRIGDAEFFVKKAVELQALHKIGETILEYNEIDAVVDRLKGARHRHLEGGAMSESQSPTSEHYHTNNTKMV